MKYLELSEVIAIHDELIQETGGLKGFSKTQLAYLESALEHIKNDDYYPSLADKLTHLIFSCVKFHPFSDGNKRTAIFLAMHFLDLDNKYSTEFAKTMEDVVVKLAEDSLSKEELKELLLKFTAAK